MILVQTQPLTNLRDYLRLMTTSAKILIVDDQEANRSLLSDFISMLGYTPILAENGLAALKHMNDEPADLVLLDIAMPVMDGYQVLDEMKKDARLRHLPVIVVSGVDEMESIAHCIEKGAEDYLTKPFNTTVLRARVKASLERKRLYDQETRYKRLMEEYSTTLAHRVREQVQEISSTQLATIFAMSKLAESRDPDTGEHLERMREYGRLVARHLNAKSLYPHIVDWSFLENIYAAAPLHDIGKVAIPDRILQKPGELTPKEFDLMKLHTQFGADTLRAVDREHPGNAFVRMGIEIAESHHEWWDGTGYPNGWAGNDIPLSGRILALADVYDALTSKRCYKEAYSHEESKAIIVEGRGTQFDPVLTDVFLAEEKAFLTIGQQFVDTNKKVLLPTYPADQT